VPAGNLSPGFGVAPTDQPKGEFPQPSPQHRTAERNKSSTLVSGGRFAAARQMRPNQDFLPPRGRDPGQRTGPLQPCFAWPSLAAQPCQPALRRKPTRQKASHGRRLFTRQGNWPGPATAAGWPIRGWSGGIQGHPGGIPATAAGRFRPRRSRRAQGDPPARPRPLAQGDPPSLT